MKVIFCAVGRIPGVLALEQVMLLAKAGNRIAFLGSKKKGYRLLLHFYGIGHGSTRIRLDNGSTVSPGPYAYKQKLDDQSTHSITHIVY